MLNKVILYALFIFLGGTYNAFASFDLSHRKFDDLLKNYVVESENALSTKVNYKLINQNKHLLEAYLNKLSTVEKSEYEKWPQEDQLAFLINAYNAFTIKLIIDHYGQIESIRDVGSFFSSPWKIKFIKLLGEKTDLDTIEHDWIRKNFTEPLIHGVLVCAAKSCPPLRREAYRGKILHSQLIDNMQLFLKDRNKNRYNNKKNFLELSPIFKWYRKDFTEDFGRYNSLNDFINIFSAFLVNNPESAREFEKGGFDIKFNEYDWSLNE